MEFEFLVLAQTGESKVFYDTAAQDLTLGDVSIDYSDVNQLQLMVDKFTNSYARTEETHDTDLFCELPKDRQVEARGIEVGQIFYFGTKFIEKYKKRIEKLLPRIVEFFEQKFGDYVDRIEVGEKRTHYGSENYSTEKLLLKFYFNDVDDNVAETNYDLMINTVFNTVYNLIPISPGTTKSYLKMTAQTLIDILSAKRSNEYKGYRFISLT